MDVVESVIALVLVIMALAWLWSAQSAARHCAWKLDVIAAELRAMREESAPKPRPDPAFCFQCGVPAIVSEELGQKVPRCPKCGQKL